MDIEFSLIIIDEIGSIGCILVSIFLRHNASYPEGTVKFTTVSRSIFVGMFTVVRKLVYAIMLLKSLFN